MPAPNDAHAVCPLCEVVSKSLDRLLVITATADDPDHALAAIGSWWTEQSLKAHGGNPLPFLNAVRNCLAEHGVAIIFADPVADSASRPN